MKLKFSSFHCSKDFFGVIKCSNRKKQNLFTSRNLGPVEHLYNCEVQDILIRETTFQRCNLNSHFYVFVSS